MLYKPRFFIPDANAFYKDVDAKSYDADALYEDANAIFHDANVSAKFIHDNAMRLCWCATMQMFP